jgi:tetratricopeptide (TPR) repeat protein
VLNEWLDRSPSAPEMLVCLNAIPEQASDTAGLFARLSRRIARSPKLRSVEWRGYREGIRIRLGEHLFAKGLTSEADSTLRTAIQRLSKLSSLDRLVLLERSYARAVHSDILVERGDLSAALLSAKAAVRAFPKYRTAYAQRLKARVLGSFAEQLCRVGRHSEARLVVRTISQLIVRIGKRGEISPEVMSMHQLWMARAYHLVGEHTRAGPFAELAWRALRKFEYEKPGCFVVPLLFAGNFHSESLLENGAKEEAHAVRVHTLSILRTFTDVNPHAYLKTYVMELGAFADFCLRADKLDQADTAAQIAVSLIPRVKRIYPNWDRFFEVVSHLLLGECRLASGRLQSACACASKAEKILRELNLDSPPVQQISKRIRRLLQLTTQTERIRQ